MSHLASGLSYMVGGISPLRGVGIAARAVLWRSVQPLGTPLSVTKPGGRKSSVKNRSEPQRQTRTSAKIDGIKVNLLRRVGFISHLSEHESGSRARRTE